MRQGSWVSRIGLVGLLPLSLACSSDPMTNGASGGASSSSGGSSLGAGPGSGATSGLGAGSSLGSTSGTGALSAVGDGGGLMVAVLTGGSGGGSGLPVSHDGGVIVLTAEEVAQIETAECTGVSMMAEKAPTILELVVDTSASMGLDAPGQTGVSRWAIASEALLTAIDALPAETAVGMQFFPTADAPGLGAPGGSTGVVGGACVDASGQTPIDLLGMAGSAQRTAISTAIAGAPLPFGTPTHDGFRFALDEGLKKSTIMGPRNMLLITDGAPTQELGCGPSLTNGAPTQPIIDDIAAAYAEGIRTYIIGAPGSEAYTTGGGPGMPGMTPAPPAGEDLRGWLSQAAVAGGTAPDGCAVDGPNFCHFDMTQATDFGVALAAGLAEISQHVADPCTFEMPEPPDGMKSSSLDLTSVIIKWGNGTAELVQRDDMADCTEGWVVNPEGKIAVCPATCERLKVDDAAVTNVSMGCDPAVIVVR